MTSKPNIILSPVSRTFITLLFILKTEDIDQKIKAALLVFNNPDSDSSSFIRTFIALNRSDLPREVLFLLKKAILPNINNKLCTIGAIKKAA